MLAIAIPIGDGETPASFCSRLAMRAGCRTAADFCADFGISFNSIVTGDQAALAWLAELGGVPPTTLQAGTLESFNTRDGFEFDGRSETRCAVRLDRVTICPVCLQEDLRGRPGLGGAAAYQRMSWRIAQIRTCPHHQVGLVDVIGPAEVGKLTYRSRYDFSRLMEPVIAKIDAILENAHRRSPDALERYLLDRLTGVRGGNWLDSFSFSTAARACEMVGAAATFGVHVQGTQLSEEELRTAGAAGYGVLAAGPNSFADLLRSFPASERPRSKTGAPGLALTFGWIYRWLKDNPTNLGYDPLREVFRAVAREELALPQGASVLGRRMEGRYLHTVRTLATQAGIGCDRVRRVLSQRRILTEGDLAKMNRDITVRASEEIERLLGGLKIALNLVQVADRICATRRQVGLLVDDGILTPIVSGEYRYSFERGPIDTFMSELLCDAVPMIGDDPDFVDIQDAARRSRCRSVEVVRLILGRKLNRTRLHPEKTGYASVLVDLEEVRSLLKARLVIE